MKLTLPNHFSVYLDLIRVIAAAVVVLSHYPISSWQADITNRFNIAYDAVIVFFVLSGYVITYATAERESDPVSFISSRAARILPTAIASVILSLCLMLLGAWLRPDLYPEAFQLNSIPFHTAISFLFLGEIWWLHVTPFGNGPYWSLTFEVWCYVFFGILYFCRGWYRAASIFLLLIVAGPKLIILLPIWFAGSICYHFSGRRLARSSILNLAFFAPAIAYLLIQLNLPRDWSYYYVGSQLESLLGEGLEGAANFGWGYILTILFSIHLYAAYHSPSILSPLNNKRVSHIIKLLASYTFSLYIFHYPLIIFFRAIVGRSADGYDLTSRVIVYTLTLVTVWLLAHLFEFRKNYYRRAFTGLLLKFRGLDLYLRARIRTKAKVGLHGKTPL